MEEHIGESISKTKTASKLNSLEDTSSSASVKTVGSKLLNANAKAFVSSKDISFEHVPSQNKNPMFIHSRLNVKVSFQVFLSSSLSVRMGFSF